MRDDSVYLRHIAASMALVKEYLTCADGDPSQQLFYKDQRAQDAGLRRLETLADAAGHLSTDLKTRHPTIPWRQISDFRNVLAHGYADIRLDRAWSAIVVDRSALKAVVHEELGRASSP